MKRGLSLVDLFTTHLAFEPYPMALYILIILLDGMIYLLLEVFFHKIYNKKLTIFRYIPKNVFKRKKDVSI